MREDLVILAQNIHKIEYSRFSHKSFVLSVHHNKRQTWTNTDDRNNYINVLQILPAINGLNSDDRIQCVPNSELHFNKDVHLKRSSVCIAKIPAVSNAVTLVLFLYASIYYVHFTVCIMLVWPPMIIIPKYATSLVTACTQGSPHTDWVILLYMIPVY